jgi:hypothetical protein
VWQTVNQKGNAKAREHLRIIKRLLAEIGKQHIAEIYGDREFASQELFSFLLAERIDFRIRLKTSYLVGGISFKTRWRNLAERVKLKGKKAVAVFGLEVYVSCVKLKKAGRTEYLIVASGKRSKDALAEYKVRWAIETMFGCLKSRGFEMEETQSRGHQENQQVIDVIGSGIVSGDFDRRNQNGNHAHGEDETKK